MAGNAFGFSQYPQRPTVDPRTVGQALVSQGMQAQQAMPAPMSPMPAMGMEPMGAPSADGLLAGPDGGDQHEDSAIQAMRHEAQRRVGFALEQGQQRQPAPAFAQEQLQRLGLSPAEIRLLRMAGGTK